MCGSRALHGVAALPQPTLAAASSPVRPYVGAADRHGLDPREPDAVSFGLHGSGTGVSREQSVRMFKSHDAIHFLAVAVVVLAPRAHMALRGADAGRSAARARRAKRALDDV
jgi:hypothetical protein